MVALFRGLSAVALRFTFWLSCIPGAMSTSCYGQWRRSVVKSEGSGSLRSSHQTRSRPKFVFVFGAENGLFVHFRIFSFSAEKDFFFHFFRPKMPFALGRKCYVRNWTVTKFCDIGTGDFRYHFSAEKVLFSSAFSFTAENEKCIFGRSLHQTVSDYTLRQ